MKIVNGKIKKCTDVELYSYWLKSDWCKIYDYQTYKQKCINAGTEVEE